MGEPVVHQLQAFQIYKTQQRATIASATDDRRPLDIAFQSIKVLDKYIYLI